MDEGFGLKGGIMGDVKRAVGATPKQKSLECHFEWAEQWDYLL